jgi:putative cytotoxic protein
MPAGPEAEMAVEDGDEPGRGTLVGDLYDDLFGSKAAEAPRPVAPSQSRVFKSFRSFRGMIRTNGLAGSQRRYYAWDYTHNDIEMYDKTGKHLGTIDPITGDLIKDPVKGRNIDVR